MNRRPWLTPVLIAGFVAIIVGLYLQRPREPDIQGKQLSQWLEELDTDKPPETRERAKEAVRQLGTNAIPALLEMLRTWDTGARRKQMAFGTAQATIRQQRALNAFQALGAMAVPGLSRLLFGENAAVAARALSKIGGDGVLPLTQALTNESARVRELVELGLESGGSEAKVFVPALMKNLKDDDQFVRAYAAKALGTIGQEPDTVVPVLVASLQDSSAEVRIHAAHALGQFGRGASSAIPALLKTGKDHDGRVYRAVFAALKQIDPEAAARAGVK